MMMFAFKIDGTKPVTIDADTAANPVIATAFEMLDSDMKQVLGKGLAIKKGKKADISLRINPADEDLAGKPQAFKIEAPDNKKLAITASDAHGAAYGLLEISRLMGVSPWEWWADSHPDKLEAFTLPKGYKTVQSPSVEYRGIFINDEDWGLMPWSSKEYEPTDVRGQIGPRTTAKIFELMLRLRANYYWPPMHESSRPFFLTPGNREVAQKYGIYVGGSHCEPMASSAAVEWKERGVGDYDYVNNAPQVYSFWEERVKDVAKQPIIYTVGMRGVHDGAMQGAKTTEEQKAVLTRVIADQRKLLNEYVGEASTVPQVFVPYKEVLDVYNAGLEVPDDICLMWCDDNYGYIRHFPTEAENRRKGGNGVYYHVSYWGRPHDYLWLGTFSPYLLHQQMSQAYDSGIRRMWILNVGDIKPAEYQTELFLDMAWNIDDVNEKGVEQHMARFLSREFGDDAAARLVPVMNEHYLLAFERKPEFMGNTRTEERDPAWKKVKDLPWTSEHIHSRLNRYKAISDEAESVASIVPDNRQDAYFQLVKYPVQGAAQMNAKALYAQLARHGMADAAQSQAAYDSIAALTALYNQGKFKGIMDMRPRRLAVYDRFPTSPANAPLPANEKVMARFNAADMASDAVTPIPGLGYEGKAAILKPGVPVNFELAPADADSLIVELAFIPTHPATDGGDLRVEVATGSSSPITLSYRTKGRSEEWKENVLNNRAVKAFVAAKPSKITIKALDPGVILDQVSVKQPLFGE